jgi:hypothetical protein
MSHLLGCRTWQCTPLGTRSASLETPAYQLFVYSKPAAFLEDELHPALNPAWGDWRCPLPVERRQINAAEPCVGTTASVYC